ncbi:MAG: GAF domain-containing protein, partial [Gammaproteobacteria bacterium]|nr:GAF domain-containing protein [Gammaproteobacteria bacterium]
MLENLRRIVQAVNNATSLNEVLGLIVYRVKRTMDVDVCSVYLSDDKRNGYTLMATDGLNQSSVGKVRLAEDEGLVGLVGRRQEPVNLNNAFEHTNFLYLPETGEDRYRSFLGVPIIHSRKNLGVLVMQHVEPRRFTSDEVDFLVTIAAQLAGAIMHAAISGETGNQAREHKGSSDFHQGVPGAPGVAIGTIALIQPLADLNSVPDRHITDVEAEEASFRKVVASVQEELRSDAERMSRLLPSEATALFDVHVMLLGSESLISEIVQRIRAGNWAPAALRETVKQHARFFDDLEDTYLR